MDARNSITAAFKTIGHAADLRGSSLAALSGLAEQPWAQCVRLVFVCLAAFLAWRNFDNSSAAYSGLAWASALLVASAALQFTVVSLLRGRLGAVTRLERLGSGLANCLLWTAFGVGVLVLLVTRNLALAASVFILCGTAGVTAGTPLALFAAVKRAHAHGIPLTGETVERLAKIDTAVINKTAALSTGKMAVIGLLTSNGVRSDELLSVAASAGMPSEQPSALAIRQKACDFNLSLCDPDHFHYTPGKGIVCRLSGKFTIIGTRRLLTENGVDVTDPETCLRAISEVFVAQDGHFLGVISLADTVRCQARAAISDFKHMRISTILFTCEAEPLARMFGDHLGVDKVEAELFAEDKTHKVASLRSTGRRVLILGDGLTDIRLLDAADVGVAIGASPAQATIVLANEKLPALTELIRCSRLVHQAILLNGLGTVLVVVAGVAAAIVGLVGPLRAAFISVAAELLFLVNAARLLAQR